MCTRRDGTSGAIVAVLLGLAAVPAWGQSQSITLSGIVSDASGAVVPRVKIRLLNVETGEEWSVASNERGNYTVPLVKPGRYSLTGEAAGFKQYHQTGIVLVTGVPA